MKLLIGLSSVIDFITRAIGKTVSWLVLAAVLVSAYNATIRYLGGSVPYWVPIPRASNALLELQWYLYGAVFLLAAAWTLQDNEHIRIDLLSNRLSKRTRDIVDLAGHLIALLPFAGLLIWLAWPWFWRSYYSGEISGNTNGLTLWPAKLLLLSGFILLFAQGVSEAIKRLAVMTGRMDDPHADKSDLPPAVAEMESGSGLGADDIPGKPLVIDLIAHELAPIMFVSVMAILLIGYPVAFSLAAGGLAFFVIGVGFSDVSHEIRLFWPLLGSHPERIYGVMSNDTLLAIPFFTFMGLILERSRMAEDLLETIGQLFGPVRGGLAYAVVIVGALLAATTGVVAASVIAMGLISLPIMMRYGYDRSFATGTIAGAGTLAQVVPPSLVLIVMADQLGRSVGDMYVGALIPAAIIICLYCLYVFGVSLARPHWAPALPPETRTLGTGVTSLIVILAIAAAIYVLGRHYLFADLRYEVSVVWSAVTAVALALLVSLLNRYAKLNLISRLAEQVIIVLIPPLALIFLVLGTIFLGIATPTEGGAMGATGALLLAVLKRRMDMTVLRQALYATTKLSSFVMFILIGARVFGLTFYGINGNVWIEDLLLALPGGQTGFLIVVTILVFILGCFLDFFEIAFILVPLLAPVAEKLGIDLIWFGIILGVNLQASFLTPPFGFALFYLRSIAPKAEWLDTITSRTMPGIRTTEIYKGAVPFILLQVLVIGLIIMFPGLVTHYKDEPIRVTAPAEPSAGGGATPAQQEAGTGNPMQLRPLNLQPGGNTSGGGSGLQLPSLGAPSFGNQSGREQPSGTSGDAGAAPRMQLAPPRFGTGGQEPAETGSGPAQVGDAQSEAQEPSGAPAGLQLPQLQPLGSPALPPQEPTDQN